MTVADLAHEAGAAIPSGAESAGLSVMAPAHEHGPNDARAALLVTE